VLSGLLVGGGAIKAIRKDSFRWKRYLIHRLTRLWTVLLPALLVGWLVDSWYFHHFYLTNPFYASWDFTKGLTERLHPNVFFGNAVFLQSIEHTGVPTFGTNSALWSLSYEFWYYITFPFLGLLLLSRHRKKRFWSLLGLAACLIFLWKKVAIYFAIWLAGALVYVLPKKIPARMQKSVNVFLGLLFLGMVAVVRTHHMPHFLGDFLLGIFFGALMYGVLHRTHVLESKTYTWIAHTLSKPSYTLYLFHLPISILLCAYLRNPSNPWRRDPLHLLALLCISLGVFVLCYMIYLCFEAQTPKIRAVFESRWS
jgi:peptidoglycan/LPS O-acetylase OafA/YrhL